MSSLFSDPPFPRGATLLAGEAIDLDPAGLPIAGREIEGQIKVFPDLSPGTGPASIRYSNRLVYCVAARYLGTSNINVGGADKGKWYALSRRGALTGFLDAAAASDVTDGRTVGVLDEYLNTEVRPNDIVWLVVKGPTAVAKGATTVIPGGLGVEIAAGLTVTKATQANLVGQCIDPATPYAATTTNGSAVATLTSTSGISVGMPVTGTNIPAGAHVASVDSATQITLSANATGAAVTIFVGGPLRTATTARISVNANTI